MAVQLKKRGGKLIFGGGGIATVGAVSAGLLGAHTLYNESGSAVSSGVKWPFNYHFQSGDVDPSTEKLVLKYGGVELSSYQQDLENNHDDGSDSLRSARFWIELPAGISDGSSLALEVSKATGSPDNTTSIAYTDVTGGSDITIEVDIGGTTYFSDLNDLMASAAVVEQGPLAVTWEATEMLHDSNPTAHARAYAKWYITWFDDDTYRVWVALGNGLLEDSASSYTATRISLKDGATTLIEETSISKTVVQGQWLPVVDGDGEAYWSDGFPDLTNAPDMTYIEKSGVVPRMASSLEAAMSNAASLTYVFNDSDQSIWNSFSRAFNQGGANAWLGPIPQWTGLWYIALYGTDGALIRSQELFNRCRAIGWMIQPHAFYASGFTFGNPVHGHNNYAGMSDCSSIRTHSSEGWFNGSGNDGGGYDSDWDAISQGSHAVSATFGPWVLTGDPWWAEDVRLKANCLHMSNPTTNRLKTINGTTYAVYQDGYQERTTGWQANAYLQAALVTPDGHYTEDYWDDTASEQFQGLAAKHSETYANGGDLDTQKALAFLLPSGHTPGWNRTSPWMQNYCHMVFGQAARLGITGGLDCVNEYVVPFNLGWANAGPERTTEYRIVYWNSDELINDATKTAYQTWEEMWGGPEPTDPPGYQVGSDCALMTLTSVSGTFVLGETVTGGTSAETARIVDIVDADNFYILAEENSLFTLTETITGGTSGATGTFSSRTYVGDPLVPNSTLKVGDSAPDGSVDVSSDHYHSLWLPVWAYAADVLSDTNQSQCQGHWDDWWAAGEAAFTASEMLDLAQYMYRYDGAVD